MSAATTISRNERSIQGRLEGLLLLNVLRFNVMMQTYKHNMLCFDTT